MNATANPNLNLPLVPAAVRFAIAVAVALVLALAWIAAEHESHDAVLVAGTNIRTAHVMLPAVEIMGRRTGAKTNA